VEDDRFSIRVQRPADRDGVVVLEVAGDVDLKTAPDLERELFRATETGAALVLVDLTGCTFIDSSALNALVHGKGAADAAETRLAIVCPSENLMRVLTIAGLDRVLEVRASRETVLA
jgi:anti-sigma B factor antagonist